MTNPNELVLQEFNVKDFGGIDNTKPVLLHFKDNENITIVEGEQESGKTSWITAALGIMGGRLELAENNYVNKSSGKIDVSLVYEFRGRKFRTTWTKSYLKVQEFIVDDITEKEKWVDRPQPTEFLKHVFGSLGVTPMTLRTKDGAFQVEEFKKILGQSGDVKKKEDELKSKLDEATKARTDANREYTGIKKRLDTTPMYLNWEESEKRYSEEKNADALKGVFQEASTKKRQYENSVTELARLEKEYVTEEQAIQDLEIRLAMLKAELVAKGERIAVGKQFIKDNTDVEQKYQQAESEYMNVANYNAEYKQWLQVKQDKSDMDGFETLVQQFDTQKDSLKAQMRELYKSFMPDIEGLEIIASDDLDPDKKTGVYYKEKPISILSESELWNIYLTIWDALNIKFVFIDNVSSLGSGAVDTINKLAKHGVRIFGAQMKRHEPFTLTIKSEL